MIHTSASPNPTQWESLLSWETTTSAHLSQGASKKWLKIYAKACWKTWHGSMNRHELTTLGWLFCLTPISCLCLQGTGACLSSNSDNFMNSAPRKTSLSSKTLPLTTPSGWRNSKRTLTWWGHHASQRSKKWEIWLETWRRSPKSSKLPFPSRKRSKTSTKSEQFSSHTFFLCSRISINSSKLILVYK